MSVEGIFRKNGNIRRMNQVIEAIDRDPTSVEFAQENPVQLAALLKKFLREMPDPLLTYRLYKVWLSVQCESLPGRLLGSLVNVRYSGECVGQGKDPDASFNHCAVT
jgi:hypothetical protein